MPQEIGRHSQPVHHIKHGEADGTDSADLSDSLTIGQHSHRTVSKTDSQPTTTASKNRTSVPEKKTIRKRNIAKRWASQARTRLASLQREIVSSILINKNKSTEGQSRFETLLLRKFNKSSEADGVNVLSKKDIKRAVNMNRRLVKQQGNMLLQAVKSTENRSIASTVTKVQGPMELAESSEEAQDNIASHALFSAAAYRGFNTELSRFPLPEGCSLLKKDELPDLLKMHYDETSGLLIAPDNVKALLVKQNDRIVVAFAGTEAKSKSETSRGKTIETDITQWLGMKPPMYRSAAAVFDLLLSHKPLQNTTFSVTGHSLGGGLAQFAYTAVQLRHDDKRFDGAVTINSAGLSSTSLKLLNQDRIDHVKNTIQNVRIKGDPVSPSGKKRKAGLALKGKLIGSIMTLPDPEERKNVHSCFTALDAIEAHINFIRKKT